MPTIYNTERLLDISEYEAPESRSGDVVHEWEICPKCGYDHVDVTFWCHTREYDLQCARCGYLQEVTLSHEGTWGSARYKCREDGGAGSLHAHVRGEDDSLFFFAPRCDDDFTFTREELKPKYDVYRYSYLKDGQWYLKDALTGKVIPFSYDAWMASPGDPDDGVGSPLSDLAEPQ